MNKSTESTMSGLAHDLLIKTQELAAAQKRAAELHNALQDMAQSWRRLANGMGAAPYHDGKRDALRECADDLARTFDAALAGAEPAGE